MPDVYATVTELDAAMQERLANVLETRGADQQQQAMRQAFLSEIPFPRHARVLELGCGTGVLTRRLAAWPNVGEVVGVDPATPFLAHARSLAANLPNVTFQQADARVLPFAEKLFNVAVFDSTLCHMPEPERALAEVQRVLLPSGLLAIFDGDYATTTVALGDHDPLQACADATMANSVYDRWLVRRLPNLVQRAGFDLLSFRSHGFVDTSERGYMMTVIERGADILVASDRLSLEAASALKSEARRRVAAGIFFGHIAYASLVARKA